MVVRAASQKLRNERNMFRIKYASMKEACTCRAAARMKEGKAVVLLKGCHSSLFTSPYLHNVDSLNFSYRSYTSWQDQN